MLLLIDIGGTTTKYAWIDEDKKLKNYNSIPTERYDYNIFISNLYNIVDKEEIEGISISIPGSLDEKGESIGISAIPCIKNKNIKDDLSTYSNLRVEIENDANCSLLSELNDGKEIKSAAAIVIGTGIGGSIIIDNKIITGFNGAAGEFGLLSSVQNGKLVIETLSASQAAVKYNEETGQDINGKELFEITNENSPAKELVEEFYQKLVGLIMNIESILNPEVIYISGAIIRDPEFLKNLEEKYSSLKQEFNDLYNPKSKIKAATYGSDSNLFGAAYNWYIKGEK